jgi:hypothetical protein
MLCRRLQLEPQHCHNASRSRETPYKLLSRLEIVRNDAGKTATAKKLIVGNTIGKFYNGLFHDEQ